MLFRWVYLVLRWCIWYWDCVFGIAMVYLVLGLCIWYWDGVFGIEMVYLVLRWCLWYLDAVFGIWMVFGKLQFLALLTNKVILKSKDGEWNKIIWKVKLKVKLFSLIFTDKAGRRIESYCDLWESTKVKSIKWTLKFTSKSEKLKVKVKSEKL